MLSMVSSIYDPLGFAALFILEVYTYTFLEVSDAVKRDWKNCVTKLNYIKKLHIRCLKPDNFSKMVNE